MSETSRIERELPRLFWLGAALLLVAGYYVIVTRYERAIDASLAASERYYSTTVANDRIIHESSRLVALQKKVDGDLAKLRTRDSIASTEQLLQVLEATGRRFEVSVLSIQPEQLPDSKQKSQSLVPTGLTIRIRGNFRGILRFIEDLPRRHALLTLGNTEIRLQSGASAVSPNPTLEATIHVTTYTIHSIAEEADALAR